MSSTISAARSALYDLLVATAWPGDDPQVTYGAPAAYEEQEVVALLGVEAPEEEPAVIGGPRPRQEQYTLVVGVKSHDPAASTGEEVDARAWTLADSVRSTVYANDDLSTSLGTAGWARVASQTSAGAQAAQGGGWVCFVEVRILCTARIA